MSMLRRVTEAAVCGSADAANPGKEYDDGRSVWDALVVGGVECGAALKEQLGSSQPSSERARSCCSSCSCCCDGCAAACSDRHVVARCRQWPSHHADEHKINKISTHFYFFSEAALL